ncbi:MAG: DUF4911 domain-containing protein [Desulfonatronovibrionaceae bacterium]
MNHKIFSNRLYIELPRKDIALFKFLLESRDNLAYLTVIDKYRAVVQVVFGQGFEKEVHEFVQVVSTEIPVKVLLSKEA